MRAYWHNIQGRPRLIRYVEAGDPSSVVEDFLRHSAGRMSVDIETTGLDVFARDFQIRLVQFGTSNEAIVLPVEYGGPSWCWDAAEDLLARSELLIVHTTDYFDLLALDRSGLAPLETTLPKTVNTYLLAHLLDPRAKGEGVNAIGHQLEALCRRYNVDPDAKEAKDALKVVFRQDYKATLDKGWAAIAIDDPTYVLYAGLDAIHTYDLFMVLSEMVRRCGFSELSKYEHAIARVTAKLMRKGMLLDVQYTEKLVERFTIEGEACKLRAADLGCANINAPKQVAAALQAMGWKPTAFTETGQPQVGKDVLEKLEDLGNPLAEAIRQGKRAGKWRDSYAQSMLDVRDSVDRVHPKIASLKARTARMSISSPPLQQLPSRDAGGSAAWLIRRCLLADDGNVVVSVDYETLEMRLLAVLAGIDPMLQSIRAGEDLHAMTAAMIYGPEFTAKHRKIAKNVGYGFIYGGGEKGVAKLTGAPLNEVRHARDSYKKAFPEIERFSSELRSEALNNDLVIVTERGRALPVDGDRLYAAVNYRIQSLARDILADALLEADRQGLTPYMLLPVHDEILAQAPPSEAMEVAASLAGILRVPDFGGISLDTSMEVGGRSWGSLYGAPDDVPTFDLKEAA